MRIDLAVSLGLSAILVTGVAGASAFGAIKGGADHGQDQAAMVLQSNHVSLAQAVSAAERQLGAYAYKVAVDFQAGQPRIVVGTDGPTGFQTVSVDARDGQVVASHAGAEAD